MSGPDIGVEEALAGGATVVCVSVGLARELHARAAQIPRAGAAVWRTPRIVAWQNWLRLLLTELIDRGAIQKTLLGAAEERLLWQTVVEASEQGRQLLAHRGAARAAAEAARICARFDIDDTELAISQARETRIFAEWQQHFQQYLDTHEALAPYAIDDVVAANLETVTDALPGQLVLAGFDDLNPAGQRMLARLRALGVRVSNLKDERPPAIRQIRIEADDARNEVEAICAWAAEHLRGDGNTARLGITAPDINALRVALDTPLANALADYPGAYPSSTAQSLKDEPAIHDALTLLRACVETVDAEQLCNTLRGFNSFGLDEWAAHVEFESSVLEALPRKVRLAQLMALWPEADARAAGFAPLRTQLEQASAYAPPSTWARRFAQWLALAGWPGPGFGEHIAEALTPAFAQVTRLERMLERCSGAQAVAELEAVLGDTPPLGQPLGRVRLMSMDDAAHARVDALWIANADEKAWPRAARPVALLTVELQRNRGVPGVTAPLATARDRALSEQLMCAATEVTVSHGVASGDRTLRISPLFEALPTIARDSGSLVQAPASAQDLDSASHLEWLDDWHGVPVPENEHMRGGTRLLADQSQCPFRAYTLHRLGVTVREAPVLGLDRRDAGSLLHRALEFIWDRLGDSATLEATSEADLQRIVANATARAVTDLQARVHALVDPNLARLEQERLTRLCTEWLAFEKARPHAFKVLLQERRERTRVGPLELDIQIDRIDQLDDGTHAVIDYKSGEVSAARWFDERLDEPQVPLYATARDEAVSAALIAQVKSGKLRFQGAVANDAARPSSGRSLRVAKDDDEWLSWLTRWREQLVELATEAADGLATVTPSNHPSTCRYCDVRPACRIDGRIRDGEDDVEPE